MELSEADAKTKIQMVFCLNTLLADVAPRVDLSRGTHVRRVVNNVAGWFRVWVIANYLPSNMQFLQ